MSAVDVVGQLVEQVAVVGDPLGAVVPEVVVRVTDGDLGLQGFFLSERVPVVASKGHNQPPFYSVCMALRWRER